MSLLHMPRSSVRRGEPFWDDRKVAWYRRANERSDYSERVLGAVADLVAECRSALDVGAGFGALAIPLARRLERVTALEPAPAMAKALREEAGRQGFDHLVVIEAAWGDVPLEPHDLVLCAHVGPLLGRGSSFLRATPALARHGVVLVRDLPSSDDKFFFEELYPRLLGIPYERTSDYAETLHELAELGITPTVTPIEYASDQPFDSLEEACDFWMEYMGVTGASARATLRDFLAPRLHRRREGRCAAAPARCAAAPAWIAPFRKRAAVIHWRGAVRGRTGRKEVRS